LPDDYHCRKALSKRSAAPTFLPKQRLKLQQLAAVSCFHRGADAAVKS
jgi:hypothetical protein